MSKLHGILQMNADPYCGHPGSLDTTLGGLHHCDVETTPDIAVCTGLWLPTLGGDATDQVFHSGICLSNQQAFHRDNKGG